ncbi:unnamed protein product, partial [Mesorhabditis spiculigera]
MDSDGLPLHWFDLHGLNWCLLAKVETDVMIGCVGQEVVAGLSCAGALETSSLSLPTCDQPVHDAWLFIVLGALVLIEMLFGFVLGRRLIRP